MAARVDYNQTPFLGRTLYPHPTSPFTSEVGPVRTLDDIRLPTLISCSKLKIKAKKAEILHHLKLTDEYIASFKDMNESVRSQKRIEKLVRKAQIEESAKIYKGHPIVKLALADVLLYLADINIPDNECENLQESIKLCKEVEAEDYFNSLLFFVKYNIRLYERVSFYSLEDIQFVIISLRKAIALKPNYDAAQAALEEFKQAILTRWRELHTTNKMSKELFDYLNAEFASFLAQDPFEGESIPLEHFVKLTRETPALAAELTRISPTIRALKERVESPAIVDVRPRGVAISMSSSRLESDRKDVAGSAPHTLASPSTPRPTSAASRVISSALTPLAKSSPHPLVRAVFTGAPSTPASAVATPPSTSSMASRSPTQMTAETSSLSASSSLSSEDRRRLELQLQQMQRTTSAASSPATPSASSALLGKSEFVYFEGVVYISETTLRRHQKSGHHFRVLDSEGKPLKAQINAVCDEHFEEMLKIQAEHLTVMIEVVSQLLRL